MRAAFLILALFLCFFARVNAQEKAIRLVLKSELPIKIKYSKSFKDTIELFNEIKHIELSLKSKGYIHSRLISRICIENICEIDFFYGDSYAWGDVRFDPIATQILSQSSVKKEGFRENKKVNKDYVSETFEKLLTYAEEHGYPFAEIKFDSVVILQNRINALIRLQLNNFIKIDSIRILGDKAIHKSFLTSYIGIKEGDVYNERKLKAINDRVEELGFIRLKYAPQVAFVNNSSELTLVPEKRNANRFDGLIGVLPSSGNNQKTAIVGQAQLYLVNILERGEKVDLEFRSQPNSTRDLKVRANYPFIASLPFGIDAGLVLRRQDTTFSQLSRDVGFQYLLRGSNYIKVLYKVDQSTLLSTKAYENATVLPAILDVKKRSYGVSLYLEELDYRINPRTGYQISVTGLIGTRNVQKNQVFADSLFDGIKLRSDQIQLDLRVKRFFNLSGKHVLMLGVNSGILQSENLFINELLRIGGINDLRGFDEESIFHSSHAIGTVEYRYLIDRNSFFRLFYDQAYYENSITRISDHPFGLGAGIQVQTAAGMLQLSYAIGKQFDNPLNFQSGKIHFGIINYF